MTGDPVKCFVPRKHFNKSDSTFTVLTIFIIVVGSNNCEILTLLLCATCIEDRGRKKVHLAVILM